MSLHEQNANESDAVCSLPARLLPVVPLCPAKADKPLSEDQMHSGNFSTTHKKLLKFSCLYLKVLIKDPVCGIKGELLDSNYHNYAFISVKSPET